MFTRDEERKIRRGRIPWDVYSLLAAIDFEFHLAETPKDDWDLSERGFDFTDEADRASRLRLQMHKPAVQVAVELDRINQLCSFIERIAHFTRYAHIRSFTKEHRERLIADGFIRQSDEDAAHGNQELSVHLLKALAVTRFKQRRKGSEGDTYHTFAYDEVIAKAKEMSSLLAT